MSCARCQDLERALDVGQREYDKALASVYHRVSKKFAAFMGVELERARNELEEHRLVCASFQHTKALVTAALRRFAEDEFRGDRTHAAA